MLTNNLSHKKNDKNIYEEKNYDKMWHFCKSNCIVKQNLYKCKNWILLLLHINYTKSLLACMAASLISCTEMTIFEWGRLKNMPKSNIWCPRKWDTFPNLTQVVLVALTALVIWTIFVFQVNTLMLDCDVLR